MLASMQNTEPVCSRSCEASINNIFDASINNLLKGIGLGRSKIQIQSNLLTVCLLRRPANGNAFSINPGHNGIIPECKILILVDIVNSIAILH